MGRRVIRRLASGVVAVCAAVCAMSLTMASGASAQPRDRAVITVTTAADLAPPCPSGSVSLRCAIAAANRGSSPTTIAFAIPASDAGCGGTPLVCMIAPATALPAVRADDVTIDGYTQPGASANTLPFADGDDATIVVRVDGAAAPAGTSGLVLTGARDVVRGLSITGFVVCFDCGGIPGEESGGSAIEMRGPSDVVDGDFLGVLPDGMTAGANEFAGVDVTGTGASNGRVGGPYASSTNVIGGNRQCGGGDCQGFGVYVDVNGAGTLVERNLIGTTRSGRSALPNAATGVVVLATKSIVAGNVISASGGDGVLSGGRGARFAENLIGTDVTGTVALENHSHGLDVQAQGDAVRGNVISGNGDTGLVLSSTGAVVRGNLVGTDATGSRAIGNGFDPSAIFLGQPINGTDGIVVCGGGNTIGGSNAGDGNVVSGNRGDGIFVGSGDDSVQGNLVGTDAGGAATIPNHADGIGSRPMIFQGVGFCEQAPNGSGGSNVTIGGDGGAANVVAGNRGGGIDMIGLAGSTIASNLVGTNATGTSPLGNGSDGVSLGGACEDRVCVPSANDAITGNVVGANGGRGVVVSGRGGGTGIAITGNRIGAGPDGSATLGNAGAGVVLEDGASVDVVGGGAAGDGNVVAGNGGPGIQVGRSERDRTTRVAIEGNSTFANAGLGIDLAPVGTVDCSTPPPGPNDDVPCPVITGARPSEVRGTACAGCTVEVFAARPDAGDSGHGEGAVLLARVLASPTGAWSASIPSGELAVGDPVTATATTPASTVPAETSEFAANVGVG